MRRYIKWCVATKKEYGSIMAYVMQKRLKWKPTSRSTAGTGPLFDYQSPVPFRYANDYKILPNDWPYGLDKGIVHLIVWLKNRLDIEPPRGDMTLEARAQVEAFVRERFIEPIAELHGGPDRVIWFKNWVSLQSVPGIDHVHVLVRDVSQSTIDQCWTKGERSIQEQVVT